MSSFEAGAMRITMGENGRIRSLYDSTRNRECLPAAMGWWYIGPASPAR